jgi:hypothetical protein
MSAVLAQMNLMPPCADDWPVGAKRPAPFRIRPVSGEDEDKRRNMNEVAQGGGRRFICSTTFRLTEIATARDSRSELARRPSERSPWAVRESLESE